MHTFTYGHITCYINSYCGILKNKLSSQLSYTIFYKRRFDTLFISSQFSIRLNQPFFK